MKKFWIRKGFMFFFLFIGAMLLFGLLVMGLWNAILPAVLGVKAITFLQALGILLLSKILFGGFRGGFGRGRHHKERWIAMQQKMASMSPEEREKFKAEWKNRCGARWRNTGHENTDTGMAVE
ncbi:MAG: hypothetical protein KF741_01030 [Ferruginibacter sp.]|nr:hypothetical protein [Bacteroidota bacterium]MBX2917798.1 hypothetical protein [Ferruginibacter sp.]MCB0709110.1 hypothetical protein [Chitinophagaceae bacterium]MCC7380175.1 hypothetical protein [Chitinophagaceae bacterium]